RAPSHVFSSLWPVSWIANRELAMSLIVTIDEAQANFKDIVHRLAPGDEIIITENQQAIARIVSEQTREVKQRPAPGMFPESIVCMPPDFDAPLEEFKEYME
ncbi:MAG: type II toxin-antitoxin system Phd/YefM family antitoxin, partial [Planctomyces sp.]